MYELIHQSVDFKIRRGGRLIETRSQLAAVKKVFQNEGTDVRTTRQMGHSLAPAKLFLMQREQTVGIMQCGERRGGAGDAHAEV